jgi:CRISPR system Cascade subunit CasC
MTKEQRVYLDLHVIQTVPPSCVNRDDTGSPKTAIYGGVQRARVSSQSWKRAMRTLFNESIDSSQLGIRTKNVVDLVAHEIKKIDTQCDESVAFELAAEVIELAGIKCSEDKNTGKISAKALFFMGVKQAQNLAELAVNNKDTLDLTKIDAKKLSKAEKDNLKKLKNDAKTILTDSHAIDIALFGRMVADDPSLNEDACSQVAHSISTHRVENEYDYFTAVDEMSPEDNSGAGMIGVVEYNSATMYRYATVACHQLFNELGNDVEVTQQAIKEFVRAFILSMPNGKQNTFANRTLPDAVLVTVREDQPINFVGAFEQPVPNKGAGFVKESIERLNTYAEKIYGTFASRPSKSWSIGMDSVPESTEKVSLTELLQQVEVCMKDILTRKQGE